MYIYTYIYIYIHIYIYTYIYIYISSRWICWDQAGRNARAAGGNRLANSPTGDSSFFTTGYSSKGGAVGGGCSGWG